MSFKRMRFLPGMIVLCAALLYTGCDVTDAQEAFENLDVIIALDSIETYGAGQVVDVASGALIVGVPITLTFEAEGVGDVIDIFSDPLTKQTTTSGFASFGLRNTLTPSAERPVSVRITADAPGYEAAATTVVFTAKGEQPFELFMVRTHTVPKGASAAHVNNGTTSAQGTLGYDIAVTTPPEEQTQGTASFVVPGGTVMQDEAGQPLGGIIETRVVYFNNQDPSALRTFPGGFASAKVRTAQGTSRAALLTAGFASYEVKVAGKPVRNFDKPVQKTLEISAGAINAETKQPYRAGDAIGIYSYDAATGTWVYQTDAVLEAAAGKHGSRLRATYSSRKPSTDAAAQQHDVCTTGATININRNGNLGSLKGYLTGPNGQGAITPYTIDASQNAVQLKQAPRGTSGEFVIELDDRDVRVSVAAVCSGSYGANLPAPAQAQITVNFDVQLSCTLKTTQIPNSSLVYQRVDQGGNPLGKVRSAGGNATWKRDAQQRIKGASFSVPGMTSNAHYRFTLTIDNETAKETVQITGPNMKYSASVPAPRDNCFGGR